MMKKLKTFMLGLILITVAGFTFLVTGAAFAACPDGISAYWKMDNNFEDFIGDNDGTGNDAPTAVTGTVNGAMAFDGLNTGIDVAASRTFNWLTTESFSIEYWVKMGANTSGSAMVALGRNGGATGAYWFTGVTPAGMPEFELQDSSGSVTVTGTTPVTDNTAWHLVVAVRDASTGKILIYVDDNAPVEAPAVYTGDGFLFDSAPLTIGWLDLGGNYRLAGSLDEVALYDRALGATEIAQHYTEGLKGNDYCGGSAAPIVPGDAPYPDDTISFWPLEEDSGSKGFIDVFGDNDGTGNDSPTAVTGTVNGAMAFDGLNTGIDVAASRTFNWLTTESFSIEYWVKMGANTSGSAMVALGRNGGATGAYWFTGVTPAGMPEFELQDSSGSVTVTGTTPVTDNTAWHLVVAVRDASTGKILIYVDDNAPVEAPAVYTGDGFLFDSAPLTIGWLDLGGNYRLAGSLDEVALYDRALGATEIAQHYNAGLAGDSVTSLRPEPVANAGADQSVTEGTPVTLAGTGTPGYTGTSITAYAWVQTAGTAVALTGASTATATFTAPEVDASGETLTFQLTVTADDGLSSSNTTDVTVSDNSPATPPVSSGGGGGGCFINSLF
jgi:hypothetical protein